MEVGGVIDLVAGMHEGDDVTKLDEVGSGFQDSRKTAIRSNYP